MTKDELVARIRTEHARLDAAVARIGEERCIDPAFDGGWSLKDIFAHIGFWERACTRWLEAVARGETPDRPEVRDVDATNADAFDAAKPRALADVLAESHASYDGIIRATTSLPDSELGDERRFGFPIWRVIDGNSGEHYREHAEQIEAWLARGPAA